MNGQNRHSEMIAAALFLIFSASLACAHDWTRDDFLSHAFEQISAISVNDASKRMGDVTFLDVRTMEEVSAGHVPGSIHVPRGFLELRIHKVIPDKNKKIVIYCKKGNRSALAALTLMKMGYKSVYNLSEGYCGWKEAGCPVSH